MSSTATAKPRQVKTEAPSDLVPTPEPAKRLSNRSQIGDEAQGFNVLPMFRMEWGCVIPTEHTLQDVLRPEYFSNFVEVKTIKARDMICAFHQSGDWEVWLRVIKVFRSPNGLTVVPYPGFPFYPRRARFMQMEALDRATIEKRDAGFVVEIVDLRGREFGAEVLAGPFLTNEEAVEWLEKRRGDA